MSLFSMGAAYLSTVEDRTSTATSQLDLHQVFIGFLEYYSTFKTDTYIVAWPVRKICNNLHAEGPD